jgi:hypothetical protein
MLSFVQNTQDQRELMANTATLTPIEEFRYLYLQLWCQAESIRRWEDSFKKDELDSDAFGTNLFKASALLACTAKRLGVVSGAAAEKHRDAIKSEVRSDGSSAEIFLT